MSEYVSAQAVIEQAVSVFGAERQTRKAVEELTELSLALQRALEGRGDNDNICEEIADVEIMIAQLRFIFFSGKIDEWKDKKIARLAAKIKAQ